MLLRLLTVLSLLALATTALADDEVPLDEYFRAETARIAAKPLGGIDSADAWKARRPELQRQLLDMLGLWPLPEKTDLKARITGTVERPEFVVENLVFQSRPGLYVTGNLYRPKEVKEPLPAILYVCGHAKVEKDGVIYGNKAHYQHHAAWYAANGYVCLVVDTLQLGELPGIHHGTYREGMWWWQSRGYTSAGVEAWNGVRAIDYLISRPEVDPKKIGVTGRSGGGATSWWVGAIDDRVAAVVPVAGITDLENHVVAGAPDGPYPHGVIEGHCDCMYTVNTYRWDYPLVAALVAPKPLLVENTDKDPIFPENGVRRIYKQLETVYGWYGDLDRLGIVIGSGGHVDSEEVRHPSFAFFEKWLKGKNVSLSDIKEPDRTIPIEALKVLKPGDVPADHRNDKIQETFVAKAPLPEVPDSQGEWDSLKNRWMKELREKVFGGWPEPGQEVPLNVQKAVDQTRDGIRLRGFDFDSQRGVRLRLWLFSSAEDQAPEQTALVVATPKNWRDYGDGLIAKFQDEKADLAGLPHIDQVRNALSNNTALGLIATRGIGPTAWPEKKETHIRRRFALLGQTLDGMRVYDVRRALAALGALDVPVGAIWLHGDAQMAPVALWASVFEPEVATVLLSHLPTNVDEGPAFLNLDRVLDMPQAVALLYPRTVRLWSDSASAWVWPRTLADHLKATKPWPELREVEPAASHVN